MNANLVRTSASGCSVQAWLGPTMDPYCPLTTTIPQPKIPYHVPCQQGAIRAVGYQSGHGDRAGECAGVASRPLLARQIPRTRAHTSENGNAMGIPHPSRVDMGPLIEARG